MNLENFIDVPEVARQLGYSEHYVRQLARNGKIKSYRRGRKYIFLRSAIEKFINPTDNLDNLLS